MTQNERLKLLVKGFKTDSDEYGDLIIPEDSNGQKVMLRSLMNVRMPGKMLPESLLKIQDEYLKLRAQEKGIVTPADIPVKNGILSVWQGDITRLAVDAIVNAANNQMLGCFIPMHGCIDNCIHTYAGVELREECFSKMRALRAKYGATYVQPTALPLITDAYNLPARKIIHVVGPVVEYRLTPKLERELALCYSNILDVCLSNKLKSVAFCCISTGVFHFPSKKAAQIALDTVNDWLLNHPGIMERVIFNVFKDEDLQFYKSLMR